MLRFSVKLLLVIENRRVEKTELKGKIIIYATSRLDFINSINKHNIYKLFCECILLSPDDKNIALQIILTPLMCSVARPVHTLAHDWITFMHICTVYHYVLSTHGPPLTLSPSAHPPFHHFTALVHCLKGAFQINENMGADCGVVVPKSYDTLLYYGAPTFFSLYTQNLHQYICNTKQVCEIKMSL